MYITCWADSVTSLTYRDHANTATELPSGSKIHGEIMQQAGGG